MKRVISVFLLILFMIQGCGKEDELKEKYRPSYKSSKEVGYDISNKTKYILRNIFKAEHLKTNKYKFFITTKVYDDPRYKSQLKEPDKQYLHDYPFGLHADSSGNIYLNNYYRNKNQEIKSEIIKLGRKGKLLAKKRFSIYAGNIIGTYSDEIILLGQCEVQVIDNNLKNVVKKLVFKYRGAIRDEYPEVFFMKKKHIFVGGIPGKMFLVDLKNKKISLEYFVPSKEKVFIKYGSKIEGKKELKLFQEFWDWTYTFLSVEERYLKCLSIFDSHFIGSVCFQSIRLGVDQFGNEYSDNQSYSTNDDGKIYTDSVGNMMNPTNYILVKKHRKPIYWKIKLPNRYGKPNDINALGSRSFSITPSGIIYMMTVTLTHLYIDKYVPEPVAKKAGGADKAYY